MPMMTLPRFHVRTTGPVLQRGVRAVRASVSQLESPVSDVPAMERTRLPHLLIRASRAIQSRGTTLVAGGLGAAAFILLVWNSRTYRPFLVDDAYISLRYAERLATGSGFTWTDGERVEGYSNFLWTLLLAAVRLLTPDLVPIVGVLGTAGMGAALFALIRAASVHRARDLLSAAYAVTAFAVCGPIAAWAIGGLEQGLLAALVAWATVLTYPIVHKAQLGFHAGFRTLWLPGLLWGLVTWTRADGALLAALACAGVVIAGGLRRSAFVVALRLGAFPLAFVLLELAFRLWYYSAWLPNTYYAKVAWTPERLHTGWKYVSQSLGGLSGLWSLSVLAVLVGWKQPQRRCRLCLVLSLLLGYSAYVVAIGGDVMPMGRHLVVPIVLCLMAAVECLGCLVERRGVPLAAGIASVALTCLALSQLDHPERSRARADTWRWTGASVGRFLESAFGAQDPLLAIDAAGALPYFSHLRSLDMLGLNDRYLAQHPPSSFGRGQLGHELGDGRYILSRRPDLIVFHTPLGRERALFRGGIELQKQPEFHELYQLVRFETPPPERVRTRIWVRKEDSRLGIERTPNSVRIPGYLLSDHPESLAVRFQHEVVAQVATDRPVILQRLPLPEGRWRMSLDCSLEVEARLCLESGGCAHKNAFESQRIQVARATHASIYVERRRPGVAFLRELRIERVRQHAEPEPSSKLTMPLAN